MGKTELFAFAFLAFLGLRAFQDKVLRPAEERARIAVEQSAMAFEDKYKIPYNNLLNKITENYSVENQLALEEKVDKFAKDKDSINKGSINYASQFLYLIPKDEDHKDLFLPLFALESFGRQDAVSPAGNVGLGQLSEQVAKEQKLRIIKKGEEIVYDERCIPDLNAEASIAYYNKLYSEFKRHDLALLSYNHGPTKVRKALASLEKQESTGTAVDILDRFNHEKFNYPVKILGYAQYINSKYYSVPQFCDLFERKQIKNEKNLEEVAEKEDLSLKQFLKLNPQFRDTSYCRSGLFYIVPKTEAVEASHALAQTSKNERLK